jgi:hypothetical protein
MAASAHITDDLSVSGIPSVVEWAETLLDDGPEIIQDAADSAAAYLGFVLEDALEGDPIWSILAEEIEVRPSPDGMVMFGIVDDDPVVTDMVWRMEYGDGQQAPSGLLRTVMLANIHAASQVFQKALDREVERG